MLTVALLTVFAISLAQSQHRQREDLQKRFHDRAAVSAALTDAIFSISSTQTQAQAALRFGGPQVDPAALGRVRRQNQSLYLVIIGTDGRVLAATPGAPRRSGNAPNVKLALKSGRIQLSNLLPGPGGTKVVDTATPFRARSGPRVQLSGIGQRLLGQFLSGFLDKVPNVSDARSLCHRRKWFGHREHDRARAARRSTA